MAETLARDCCTPKVQRPSRNPVLAFADSQWLLKQNRGFGYGRIQTEAMGKADVIWFKESPICQSSLSL